MNRIAMDEDRLAELRDECEVNYPGKSTPLPGTALKLGDQVLWLGFSQMQVVWGYDVDTMFCGYDLANFGDSLAVVDGIYIDDRAPLDPLETPMPIYPQQQQQRQAGKDTRTQEERLRDLIKIQPNKDVAERMRQVFKDRGLLPGGGKDEHPGKGKKP